MKTIGIIFRKMENYTGIKNDLFTTFSSYPVKIIGIPIEQSMDKILDIVRYCDGIVLGGGSAFGINELDLVKYLYEQDIPTLGICLGMQAMVQAFNGKIEEKVVNHNSNDVYVHDVFIDKYSLLYDILGKERIKVNSRHNWCVPVTNFKVAAKSVDNVIEAIEDRSKRFFIGVQWHPESINDENSKKFFDAFINSLNE